MPGLTLTLTLALVVAALALGTLVLATLTLALTLTRLPRLPRPVRRALGRRRERVVPLIALGRAQHDMNASAAHDVMRHPLGLDSSDSPGCRLCVGS
jgi:hypothetical protein